MKLTIEEDREAPLVIGPAADEIAERLLVNARIAAEELPLGYNSTETVNLLLTLYRANDDTYYSAISELKLPGAVRLASVRRWIAALADVGLIEHSGDFASLSEAGHKLVSRIVQRMYDGQRAYR